MKAIFYGLAVIGGLVAYEAFKGLQTVSAAAPASSSPATSPTGSSSSLGASLSAIPGAWLDALAAHESPSLLQGNLNYGAFGLVCPPGVSSIYGAPCQYAGPSQDPNCLGCPVTVPVFPNLESAEGALTDWVQTNAPEALQASSCGQFASILQAHGYGNLSGTC